MSINAQTDRQRDAATGGEVVGWGGRARWAAPEAWTASRLICHELARAGVRQAFGVLGGGIAPFAEGMRRSPIRFFHFRHEAGAGFAAIEAYFAAGAPTAVVVTTGPGLFNALNAAMAARVDGAKVVVISGRTSREQLGRGAVQETGPYTMPPELTRAGTIFDFAASPETVEELRGALDRIACGFQGAGGFVAHLALPLSLQTRIVDAPAERSSAQGWRVSRPAPDLATVDACLDRLAGRRVTLWIGHGARDAGKELRAFAEAARIPVVASARAKGVFPEDHPLFVGVSGAGGSAAVRRHFREERPEVVLVVGTRLGEVTSFLLQDHTPTEGWIHVDLDPTAFSAAFPGVPGFGVVADAGAAVGALHRRALETGFHARRAAIEPRAISTAPIEPLAPRAEGEVRPAYLMEQIQSVVVEGSCAVVMSEAGNAFGWCNHALRFREAGRYRTSAAWGSMGHFTTGCVGAAIASGRTALAVVGDGSMLMNNELNTAVAYGARAVWVVLNDAQLGLNEHGMAALGFAPIETQLPRTDFVAFARSQGADGIAVDREADLAAALQTALAAEGPFVVDVRIDRAVPSPIIADRIRSLAAQGAAK
ncbi:MAG: thiamine pyrophosphate-binding protein [Byssovorax sp.]